MVRAAILAYQVENLARQDKRVETVHYLLNARLIVPPMDVEDVDVGGTQPLQGAFNGKMHILGVIADEIGRMGNRWIKIFEFVCVLVDSRFRRSLLSDGGVECTFVEITM